MRQAPAPCAEARPPGRGTALLGDEPFPSASTIKIFILVAPLRGPTSTRASFSSGFAIDLRVPGSGVLTYLENLSS